MTGVVYTACEQWVSCLCVRVRIRSEDMQPQGVLSSLPVMCQRYGALKITLHHHYVALCSLF